MKNFASKKFGLAGFAFISLQGSGHTSEATVVAVAYIVIEAIVDIVRSGKEK